MLHNSTTGEGGKWTLRATGSQENSTPEASDSSHTKTSRDAKSAQRLQQATAVAAASSWTGESLPLDLKRWRQQQNSTSTGKLNDTKSELTVANSIVDPAATLSSGTKLGAKVKQFDGKLDESMIKLDGLSGATDGGGSSGSEGVQLAQASRRNLNASLESQAKLRDTISQLHFNKTLALDRFASSIDLGANSTRFTEESTSLLPLSASRQSGVLVGDGSESATHDNLLASSDSLQSGAAGGFVPILPPGETEQSDANRTKIAQYVSVSPTRAPSSLVEFSNQRPSGIDLLEAADEIHQKRSQQQQDGRWRLAGAWGRRKSGDSSGAAPTGSPAHRNTTRAYEDLVTWTPAAGPAAYRAGSGFQLEPSDVDSGNSTGESSAKTPEDPASENDLAEQPTSGLGLQQVDNVERGESLSSPRVSAQRNPEFFAPAAEYQATETRYNDLVSVTKPLRAGSVKSGGGNRRTNSGERRTQKPQLTTTEDSSQRDEDTASNSDTLGESYNGEPQDEDFKPSAPVKPARPSFKISRGRHVESTEESDESNYRESGESPSARPASQKAVRGQQSRTTGKPKASSPRAGGAERRFKSKQVVRYTDAPDEDDSEHQMNPADRDTQKPRGVQWSPADTSGISPANEMTSSGSSESQQLSSHQQLSRPKAQYDSGSATDFHQSKAPVIKTFRVEPEESNEPQLDRHTSRVSLPSPIGGFVPQPGLPAPFAVQSPQAVTSNQHRVLVQKSSDDRRGYVNSESTLMQSVSRPAGMIGHQWSPNSSWSITTFPYPRPTNDAYNYFSVYQQQQQQPRSADAGRNLIQRPQFQTNGFANEAQATNSLVHAQQVAPIRADYSSFQAGPESRLSTPIQPNGFVSSMRLPPQEPITATGPNFLAMSPPPNIHHIQAPQLIAPDFRFAPYQHQQHSPHPSLRAAPPTRAPTDERGDAHQNHPRGTRNAPGSSPAQESSGSDMLTINVNTRATVGPNQLFWEAAAREAMEQQQRASVQANGHEQAAQNQPSENLTGKVPTSNGHLPPQHRELPSTSPMGLPLMSRRPLAAMRLVSAGGFPNGDPTYAAASQTTNGHAYAGRATAQMAAAVLPEHQGHFGPYSLTDLAQIQSMSTNPHELSYVDSQRMFGPLSPYGSAMDNEGFVAAANYMAAAAAVPASSFESPPSQLATGSGGQSRGPQPNNADKQFLKKGTAIISAALPLATPASVSDPFGWPMGYGSDAAKTLIKVNHVAPPPSYLLPADKIAELSNSLAASKGLASQDMIVPMASSVTGTWSALGQHSSPWSGGRHSPTTRPSYQVGSQLESTNGANQVASPSTTNFVQLTISTRPPEPKRSSIWQRLRALRLTRATQNSTSSRTNSRKKRGIVEQVTNLVKWPAKTNPSSKKQPDMSTVESQLHPQVVAAPKTQLAMVNEGTKISFIPLVDNHNAFDSMENDLFAKALIYSQQQHNHQRQQQQQAVDPSVPMNQRGMMGAQSMQVASYASLSGSPHENFMRPVGYHHNDPFGHLSMADRPAMSPETSDLNLLHELEAQSSNVLEPPANEPGVLKPQNQSPGARQRIKQFSRDILNRTPLSRLRKITSFTKLSSSQQSAQATNKSIAFASPTQPMKGQNSMQLGPANSIQHQVSLAQNFNNIISPSVMMAPQSVSSIENFNRFANSIKNWHQFQVSSNQKVSPPLMPLASHRTQPMSPFTLVTDQVRGPHYSPVQMGTMQHSMMQMPASALTYPSSSYPSILNNESLSQRHNGHGPLVVTGANTNNLAERSDIASQLARAIIDFQPLTHFNQSGESAHYMRPLVSLRRASDLDQYTWVQDHRIVPRVSSSTASVLQRRPTTLRSFSQTVQQPQQQPKQVAMLQPAHTQQPIQVKQIAHQGQSIQIVDPRHQYPPQQQQQIYQPHQMQASTRHQFVQPNDPSLLSSNQHHFPELSHHFRNRTSGDSLIKYSDAEIYPSSSNQQAVETLISAGQANEQSGETILSSEQASKLVNGNDASNLNVLLASASTNTGDDPIEQQHHKIRPLDAANIAAPSGEFTLEQQQQFQQQILNQQQQNLLIPPSSNLFSANHLPRPRLPKLIPSINSMASKFRQHLYQTFKFGNPLGGSRWPNVLSSSNGFPSTSASNVNGNFLMSPSAKFHPASFMLLSNFAQARQPTDQAISPPHFYNNLEPQQPQLSGDKISIGSPSILGQFESSGGTQLFANQKPPQYAANPLFKMNRHVASPPPESVRAITGDIGSRPQYVQRLKLPNQSMGQTSEAKFVMQTSAAGDVNGTAIESIDANGVPTSIGELYDQDNEIYLDSNSTDPMIVLNNSSSHEFITSQLVEPHESSVSDLSNSTTTDAEDHRHQLHSVMSEVNGNLVTSDGTYIAEEQPQQKAPPPSNAKRPFNLPARVRLNLKPRPMNVSKAHVEYEPEAEENHRPQPVHEHQVPLTEQVEYEPQSQETGSQAPSGHQVAPDGQLELERVIARPTGADSAGVRAKPSRVYNQYKHAHRIRVQAKEQPPADFRLQQSSDVNADYQVIRARENTAMIVHLINGTAIKKQPPIIKTSDSDAPHIETAHSQEETSIVQGEDQQQQQQHQHLVEHQLVYEPQSLTEGQSGDNQVYVEQQAPRGSDHQQSQPVKKQPSGSPESNAIEYDFNPISVEEHGNFSQTDGSGHDRGAPLTNDTTSEAIVTDSIATQYSSPLRPIVLNSAGGNPTHVHGNFAASSQLNASGGHEQYVLVDQPVVLTGERPQTQAPPTSAQGTAASEPKNSDGNEQPVVFVSVKPERVVAQQNRKRPLKMPKRAQMRIANVHDWTSLANSASSPQPPQPARTLVVAESTNLESPSDKTPGNQASSSSLSIAKTNSSNLWSSSASQQRPRLARPTQAPASQVAVPTASSATSIASIMRDSSTRAPKSKIRWQGMGQGNRTKTTPEGLSSSETSRSEQAWIVGGMTHQAYAGSSVTSPPTLPDAIPSPKLGASNHQSSYPHHSNHRPETTTPTPSPVPAGAGPPNATEPADSSVVELAPVSEGTSAAELASRVFGRHNYHEAHESPSGAEPTSPPANHRPHQDSAGQRGSKSAESRTAPTSFRLSASAAGHAPVPAPSAQPAEFAARVGGEPGGVSIASDGIERRSEAAGADEAPPTELERDEARLEGARRLQPETLSLRAGGWRAEAPALATISFPGELVADKHSRD